jgi:pyrophosphatase PpaX
MFDALLFDLDGTLVDTGTLILVSSDTVVREILGIEAPPEELVAAVGVPLMEQFERIARAVVLGSDHERPTGALYDREPLSPISGEAAVVVGELRDRFITRYTEVCSQRHDELIKPFDGIEEVLKTFADAGVPMGVVTSKRRLAATADLAHYNLDRYLKILVAADDLPYHKPDPRPILCGIEKLAIAYGRNPFTPSRCAYIGDSPFDLQAGYAAGCYTVAVNWGLFPETELRQENPDRLISKPKELLDLL